MYTLLIDKNAERFIKKLDKNTRLRIKDALLEIQETPFSASNVKKLSNLNLYRKRVGDIRIIYEIIEGKLIVHVIKIGFRGDIYKRY
ncbi:type II toxin-antitoxin system RelE/ParE family toxin [Bacillus timonensis]|uniref:Type II toxin-antitoxin system RelE/ParE family toxin n=1 Tax=Bacillus timonensis TaxID=1033734 RepID=A0A4S3PXT3_9BACI|nr:type II toxin-antitoxin system RelE/ParE family toxin [Bacillus timonensis]THE14707.1 type II toxin-antitoxin system RelE/ParE family toxin [Bacillus timonensis]